MTPSAMVPPARPRLSQLELAAVLKPFSIDRAKYPIVVMGVRAYYRDSMGKPGANDRGLYDDALFVDAPEAFAAFNANTDPSTVREGHGRGEGKGMASLVPGVYFVHQLALHKGAYLALCQRAGDVKVLRDGRVPYEDVGAFGINIHRGAVASTGSEGCQTIPPDQWPAFIALVSGLARRHFGAEWKRRVIPYVLLAPEHPLR